jgi:hypothetical protein
MNYNKIIFLTNFNKIDVKLEAYKDLFNKFDRSFNNFYIVNWSNLIFFKKKKDQFNIKSQFKLFNPNSYYDFDLFLKNGNNIIIADFIRNYASFGILYFLKKKNIKLVMITHMGNIQRSPNYDLRKPILTLKDLFKRNLYWYLVYFFFYLKIFTKVDVRFITNKINLDNILKNKIKNFLYEKKLFLVEKLILINSRSYDFFINNSNSTNEKYIVHLDYDLNYREEVEIRGELHENVIVNHYFHLEKFLDKLSKDYNKKVIVCTHPLYDQSKLKKYLKKYEIYKFRTREFICQSFIATHFSSSAIEDAIILKKRIIGFVSDFSTYNEKSHTIYLANKIGYEVVNTIKDYNYDKDLFLAKLNKNIINYDDHINNFHKLNQKNILGSDYIVNYLSKMFKYDF